MIVKISTEKYSVEKIKKEINRRQLRLDGLQSRCPHTSIEKLAYSNTGNYDPNDNYYWYTCYCPDCEKRWLKDQ